MTDCSLREPAATAAGSRGVPPLRRSPAVVLTLVLIALASTVLLVTAADGWRARSADLAADLGAGPVTAVPEVLRTAPAPVALEVPALGLDTRLAGLRLGPSGELQVNEDPQRAGWYIGGPAPGDLGPAVLAGHLDSRAGPGVFAGLERLRPGDQVRVRRADGTVVAFGITRVVTYAKRDFPTDEVYRGAGRAQLRIITCGGEYDARSGRYRSNTIVFADALPAGTGVQEGVRS